MKPRFLFLAAGLLSAVALPFASAESSEQQASGKEPVKAILVLDASGSMWGKVKGRAKIEIAREVVRDFVGKADPSLHLGLMAYGHRSKGDCDDIELLIPPGPIDKDAFVKVVNGLNPKGKTPLTDAVKQAAGILRSGEEKATVILVSDGLETCGKDPCEAAKLLKSDGLDFTAHVVGFDLSEEDQQSIRCLADTTGGVFVAASDADSLRDALDTVASETVKVEEAPEISEVDVRLITRLGKEGKTVGSKWSFLAEGSEEAIEAEGQSVKLAPGKYEVTATSGTDKVTATLEIPKEKQHTIELIYEAGTMEKVITLTGEGEPLKGLQHAIYKADEEGGKTGPVFQQGFQDKLTLPTGGYVIEVRGPGARAEAYFEIKNGENTKIEIALGSGNVEFEFKVGDEIVKGLRINYYVDEGEGKRGKMMGASLGSTYPFKAGNYIASIKWQLVTIEHLFSIEAGKTTKEAIAIPGGWLEVVLNDKSGEGRIKIERVKPDEGSSTHLIKQGSVSYGVPVGTYRVNAKLNGQPFTSKEVEVKVGEKATITIE